MLFSSSDNQLVAYISFMFFGTGSLITFTSAMGFLGSVKDIKCLLVTFMSFQLLVFGIHLAASVLTFVKKEEVHNQWNNRIDEVISEYGNKALTEKEPMWNILNAVQHNGCEEYLDTWFENTILILTAINVVLLIIQIFVITLTAQLFRNIKNNNSWPKRILKSSEHSHSAE